MPIRLKQLELGLPAPEREHAAPEREHPAAEREHAAPEREHAAAERARLEPATPESDLRRGNRATLAATESSDAHNGSASIQPDGGDITPSRPGSADEDGSIAKPGPRLSTGTGLPPDERVSPEPALNGNGRSHPAGRARPDWQDPYATPLAGNGHSDHDGPGGRSDLALGPWRAGNASAATVNGGSRSPDMSAGLAARPEVAPRPGIPSQPETRAPSATTGQHQAAAERSTIRPNDEIGRLTERVLTACRTAEGQSLFGGYGSSGLTPAIRRIAAQLPHGGLAPGSEANSLKSAERFAAKLARLVARNPGRPAEDLAWTIYDAIRYAFAFEPPDYTDATWLVHRILKTQGFELEARRNRWESPEYKGIWTRWRDPAHGLAFEIQFHTPASWAVVQRTHEGYVRITDPAIPPGERARLRARQVSAAVEAKPPPRCVEIADFRSEAR